MQLAPFMSPTFLPHMSRPHHKGRGKGPLRRRDLTELVVEPLAAQASNIALQILQRIQDVADSIEIIAAGVKVQVDATTENNSGSKGGDAK